MREIENLEREVDVLKSGGENTREMLRRRERVREGKLAPQVTAETAQSGLSPEAAELDYVFAPLWLTDKRAPARAISISRGPIVAAPDR